MCGNARSPISRQVKAVRGSSRHVLPPAALDPFKHPAPLPSSVPHRLDFLQEFFKSVPKLQGRKFFVTGWARAGGQEGKRGLAAPVQLLASLARFGGLLCHSSCT